VLDVTDLETLRSTLSCAVLTPDDPGYAEEVFAWIVSVQHRPDAVIAVERPQDVVDAVRWAAERKVPVSVQATGHGATDAVTGGIMISTRRLADVVVDPAARSARVGAGTRWRDVLAQSLPHGLVGVHGSSTDVGVVGYTLGGGLPVLGHAFGWAAEHVRSVQVVTPDGRLREVDADHDPELFRVLKGGKGNVGIVTGLEFELMPVQELYGGGIMYPGEDSQAVFSAFREWYPTLPPEATPSIALLRLPDAPFVPEPMRGQFVVHVRMAFLGSADEGERLVAPMRAVSTPIADMMRPMPYAEIDSVHMDPPDPVPGEIGGTLLKDFGEEAITTLLEQAGPGVQTPLLMIELRPIDGALTRAPEALDAINGRDAVCSLFVLGLLVPPIADAVPGAIQSLLTAMQPYSTGRTMVNFHGRPGDATDRARAWPPEAFAAISDAKRKYDPDNLLRFGHAVLVPTGEPAELAVPL
jgi:FAD/FMN-containing dehydrogenase